MTPLQQIKAYDRRNIGGSERPALLEQTLYTMLNRTTYPRSCLEIILCDDGSSAAVQARARELPCDHFLLAKQNRGIGANSDSEIRTAKGNLFFISRMIGRAWGLRIA